MFLVPRKLEPQAHGGRVKNKLLGENPKLTEPGSGPSNVRADKRACN